MDVCQMTFPDNSFPLIFDKATLDTIRCTFNFQLQVEQYVKEVYRVLSPGGTFVCISNGLPSVIEKYLTQGGFEWAVEVRHVPKVKPDSTECN